MRSRVGSIVFLLLILPLCAWATTQIYYSVGTRTSALYAGDASATAGVMTLASAASDSIGVGDEIRLGSNRYYITRRNSSTVFTIQNSKANSGISGATNITFASTAIEIRRAFNSLNSACTGARDPSHLGTTDLAAGNYVLRIACYGDGEDAFTGFSWDGYTTSAAAYIHIFTPVSTSQAGTSQRHKGTWSTGAYRMRDTDGNYGMQIRDNYVHIEGIQYQNDMGSGMSNNGLYFEGTTGCRVEQCIIRADTTHAATVTGAIAINPYNETDFRVYNNIIYDFRGTAGGYGILGYNRSTIYNNTIYGCNNGIGQTGGNSQNCKNNIIQKCGKAFDCTFNEEVNNISDQASGLTGTGSKNSTVVIFADSIGSPRDLHLSSLDNTAKDAGADLTAYFSRDIEGQARSGNWDIGADEYIAADAVAPVVTGITSPAGGESWGTGSTHVVGFSATDNMGVAGFLFEASGDSGRSWRAAGDTLILPSTSFSGSYNWTVSSDLASTKCMLRVTAFDAFGNIHSLNSGVFTIIDSVDPTVIVKSPNGGEDWPLTSLWDIKWTASDNIAVAACSLYISRDSGSTWAALASAAGADTTYSWVSQGSTSNQCLVRAVAIDAGGRKGYDTSNAVFRVSAADIANPVVSGVTVAGGSIIGCGTAQNLTWSSSDDHGVALCSLFYSIDNGGTYTLIKDSTANFQSYAWTVPTVVANQCRILVRAYDVLAKKGEGVSGAFAIRDLTAPTDTVVSPNGGENWAVNSTHMITWKATDNIAVSACSLFYSTNKTSWTKIGGTDGAARSYAWTLPGTAMPLCWVKVVCFDAGGNSEMDTSNAPFSVVVKPYPTSPDSVNVTGGGTLGYNLTFGGPAASISLSCISGCITGGGWVNLVGTMLTGTAPNVTRVDTIKLQLAAPGYPTDTIAIRVKISLNSGTRSTESVRPLQFGVSAKTSAGGVRFMVGIVERGDFSLEVFDLLGRRVWTHMETNAMAGYYPVDWQRASGGLGNGIFLVRLKHLNKEMNRRFPLFR